MIPLGCKGGLHVTSMVLGPDATALISAGLSGTVGKESKVLSRKGQATQSTASTVYCECPLWY